MDYEADNESDQAPGYASDNRADQRPPLSEGSDPPDQRRDHFLSTETHRVPRGCPLDDAVASVRDWRRFRTLRPTFPDADIGRFESRSTSGSETWVVAVTSASRELRTFTGLSGLVVGEVGGGLSPAWGR
jgi:hypothetical protein